MKNVFRYIGTLLFIFIITANVGIAVDGIFTNIRTTGTSTLPDARITRLGDKTTNGVLKTAGSNGTITVDTSTYLTPSTNTFNTLQSGTSTSQTFTIGNGGKLVATGTGTIAATTVPYTGITGVPTSSSTTTGVLSPASFATFSAKQNALGYTPVPDTRKVNGQALSSDISVTPGFNGISSGVSTSATFTVGNGSSIRPSGTGIVEATTVPYSGITSVPTSSATTTGVLTHSDWSMFNAKQPAGSYITELTGDVSASGPGSSMAVIPAGTITKTKMANMAGSSVIGRASYTTSGVPMDVSISTLRTMLSITLGGLPIDVTHATLVSYATNSLLVVNQTYRITDFHTAHIIPYSSATNTGPTEPLIVTAVTNTLLYSIAISELYPQDIINYELIDSSPWGGDRGRITRRVYNGIDVTEDFRAVRYRRFLDGSTYSMLTNYIVRYDYTIVSNTEITLQQNIADVLPATPFNIDIIYRPAFKSTDAIIISSHTITTVNNLGGGFYQLLLDAGTPLPYGPAGYWNDPAATGTMNLPLAFTGNGTYQDFPIIPDDTVEKLKFGANSDYGGSMSNCVFATSFVNFDSINPRDNTFLGNVNVTTGTTFYNNTFYGGAYGFFVHSNIQSVFLNDCSNSIFYAKTSNLMFGGMVTESIIRSRLTFMYSYGNIESSEFAGYWQAVFLGSTSRSTFKIAQSGDAPKTIIFPGNNEHVNIDALFDGQEVAADMMLPNNLSYIQYVRGSSNIATSMDLDYGNDMAEADTGGGAVRDIRYAGIVTLLGANGALALSQLANFNNNNPVTLIAETGYTFTIIGTEFANITVDGQIMMTGDITLDGNYGDSITLDRKVINNGTSYTVLVPIAHSIYGD